MSLNQNSVPSCTHPDVATPLPTLRPTKPLQKPLRTRSPKAQRKPLLLRAPPFLFRKQQTYRDEPFRGPQLRECAHSQPTDPARATGRTHPTPRLPRLSCQDPRPLPMDEAPDLSNAGEISRWRLPRPAQWRAYNPPGPGRERAPPPGTPDSCGIRQQASQGRCEPGPVHGGQQQQHHTMPAALPSLRRDGLATDRERERERREQQHSSSSRSKPERLHAIRDAAAPSRLSEPRKTLP